MVAFVELPCAVNRTASCPKNWPPVFPHAPQMSNNNNYVIACLLEKINQKDRYDFGDALVVEGILYIKNINAFNIVSRQALLLLRV